MREIKFRVWDKADKIMRKVYLIQYRGEKSDLIDICTENGLETYDKDFLQQYTGLRDKNGIEIYEGDIVSGFLAYESFDISCQRMPEGSKLKGVVSFCNGLFGMVSTKKEYLKDNLGMLLPFQLYTHTEYVEILGNIYENPKLLEK